MEYTSYDNNDLYRFQFILMEYTYRHYAIQFIVRSTSVKGKMNNKKSIFIQNFSKRKIHKI